MPLLEHKHLIQRPETPAGFQIPLTREKIASLSLKGCDWRKSGICVLWPCSGIEITDGRKTEIVARESLQE